MSKFVFESGDFDKVAIHCCGACVCDVVEKANALLAAHLETCPTIYCARASDPTWIEEFDAEKIPYRYQARLFNIEEIK